MIDRSVCWVDRYAKEICDAVVAKCLTGRPKTVEKAQAVFLLWVELEAVEAFLVSVTNHYILPNRSLCLIRAALKFAKLNETL